jgi:hypothetical protein
MSVVGATVLDFRQMEISTLLFKPAQKAPRRLRKPGYAERPAV